MADWEERERRFRAEAKAEARHDARLKADRDERAGRKMGAEHIASFAGFGRTPVSEFMKVEPKVSNEG